MAVKKSFSSLPKQLVKSPDRKLMGVCGGLAEYLNLDPVPIRLLWILITAFTGFVPGIVVYFLAAWIMPEK